MTRSTNMEHVEVLWAMLDDAAIEPPWKPEEVAAITAAIASLSAQQPPAEAQPVAPMTGDLLPCPFCGAPAERIDFGPGDAENEGGSCIACTRCQSSGPVEFGRKENFVANWNSRTPPPSAPVGVEALVGNWKARAETKRAESKNKDWAEWLRENHAGAASAFTTCARELSAALAQQPAAVDEVAVLRGLLDEVRSHFTRDDDLPDDLLPRIDAAFAGQQGGAK